jgi:hypothetical protein
VEYLYRILDENHPDLRKANEAIYPQALTLNADQVRDAAAAINTVTNPRPTPALTDAQQETPSGQTYTAMRQTNELRVTLAAEALNRHLTFHAPTLPDDVTQWARDQWAQAGAGGPVPGVVDGKMSEAALYNILSKIRIGNPNWYMQLASMTDTGLLRELALIGSVQLELMRKNTELLDRISVLLSMQVTSQLETTGKKEVEAAYMRAIGAQQ